MPFPNHVTMTELVLITGATGFTGRYATEILTKDRVPVRALVHKEDERAHDLRSLGAEVVVGDLLNLNDARRALEGVSNTYFIYPIAPGIIDATAYFAQAAREAGTKAIVNMSQISARRESKRKSNITRLPLSSTETGLRTPDCLHSLFSIFAKSPSIIRTASSRARTR